MRHSKIFRRYFPVRTGNMEFVVIVDVNLTAYNSECYRSSGDVRVMQDLFNLISKDKNANVMFSFGSEAEAMARLRFT